jgi:hypothetical protein
MDAPPLRVKSGHWVSAREHGEEARPALQHQQPTLNAVGPTSTSEITR